MDRLVQYRMAVIWSNLIHRLENKISILHINVWNMQIWSIDDLIVIKQNIKIEGTRSPVDQTFTVGFCFQFMKSVKQFFRSQKSAES